MKRKSLILLMACFLAFAGLQTAFGQGAQETAEEYPSKPITIYSLFGSGGGVDVTVRLLATELEDILGVRVNVEMASGAGGSVAMTKLKNDPADGYHFSSFANTPFLATAFEDLEYDVDDFTFVSSYVYAHHPLLVLSSSPWETLDEMIAWAKEHPGELTFSGGSANSPTTITTQLMFDAAGVEAEFVPYDGGGEAIVAMLGGHIDTCVAADYAGPLESGKVRVLAEASGYADPDMEGIKTYGELGYPEGFMQQYGIVAPAGLPTEKLEIMENAIKEAIQRDDYVNAIEKLGMVPLAIPSDELSAQIKKEVKVVSEYVNK